MTRFTPSAEQTAALIAYAAKHGRTWKSRLGNEWMHASASQILMTVRNADGAGPSWLMAYRTPNEIARARSKHMRKLSRAAADSATDA